jgi:Amt family ammonium transporter
MLSIAFVLIARSALAEDPTATAPAVTAESVAAELKARSVDMDTMWTLIAAFLVFWMQAGFALVETGLTRAKNTVNICMKNLLDFCFASVLFWAVGFGIMFGAGNAFMGTSGFFLNEAVPLDKATEALPATFGSLSWTPVNLDCKFIFQLVFAGTAATIVSGAMAERTKFSCYLIYSIVISAIIYPVSGHWIWGGGWLSAKGFFDFAGSTVVHSVGGWIALCGAVVVGSRIGKYGPGRRVNAIPGHSFPMMILGVFILWLGWFGFNPGSSMMASGVGVAIAHIAVTTNAAAATGTIGALLTSKLWFGKWDASMAGNGCLAGLVAITAPCAFVSTTDALIIGLIGGILVVASVVFIDRVLRIDDPVGATSVHLTNGIWGTLALGLFSQADKFGMTPAPKPGLFHGGGMEQFLVQLVGILAVGAWCLVTGFALFYAIKFTMGLRVSPEEEIRGLDMDEHGMEGYPNFQLIRLESAHLPSEAARPVAREPVAAMHH